MQFVSEGDKKRNHFLFYVTDFPVYVCKCHVNVMFYL